MASLQIISDYKGAIIYMNTFQNGLSSSIMSYPTRGKWGKSNYRGNCSGYVIQDLLNYYSPAKFVECFSGSGTGKEVAEDLGITNSIHLDLNNGWNALVDDIPSGNDFTFSHPPYWTMIDYNKINNRNNPHDLSCNMSYDEFISKLNRVNEKIYSSLINGGRHAFLIGIIKKQGKCYSITKDMNWYGDLEMPMVKVQYNTHSEKKKYHGKFIPIEHEELLIFRKKSIWSVDVKITQTRTFNIKQFESATWRDLIQAALEYINKPANLQEIYNLISDSKKTKNNLHWKEKVRQTLQLHPNFHSVSRGTWGLNIA